MKLNYFIKNFKINYLDLQFIFLKQLQKQAIYKKLSFLSILSIKSDQ